MGVGARWLSGVSVASAAVGALLGSEPGAGRGLRRGAWCVVSCPGLLAVGLPQLESLRPFEAGLNPRVPGSALSTALGGREWWAHPSPRACRCGPGQRGDLQQLPGCVLADRVPPLPDLPAVSGRPLLLPSVRPRRVPVHAVCASRSPGSRGLASSAFLAVSPLVASALTTTRRLVDVCLSRALWACTCWAFSRNLDMANQ